MERAFITPRIFLSINFHLITLENFKETNFS
jgi:hypothetical protein